MVSAINQTIHAERKPNLDRKTQLQNKYEIAISPKQRPQTNFSMVNNTIIHLRVRKTKDVYTPLLMDILSSIEFLTNTCNCRTTKSGAPLEIYCFHDYHTF
jgi:hypothetical protein